MVLPFLKKSKSPHDLVLGKLGKHAFSPLYIVGKTARSTHLYVVGKTGKGKSKFLQSCLFQDIVSGLGCGVIDPHSHLIDDLLAQLIETKNFLNDPIQLKRIMYIEPTRTDYIIPFNLLATSGNPYDIAQGVIEAFRRTWPDALSEAPRFDNIMLHALLLLIKTKRTLIHLPRLLTNPDFREGLLESSQDQELTEFFYDRYDKWGKETPLMIESVLNKVTALTMNPHIKIMVGQPTNQLDFRAIMDQGRVLLVDLGHCRDESQKLIGNLITTGIEQAIFSRNSLKAHEINPFYLYIDEFQDFTATTEKAFYRILSGARKFGLHLTLAHQNQSQLSERMRGAIMGNVGLKMIFGISEADAMILSQIVGMGNIDTTTIKHEAQTDTQHPMFAPLSEQWYEWATTLATQVPRRAILRDHEGKTQSVWTLPVPQFSVSTEAIRVTSAAQYGIPYTYAQRNFLSEDEAQLSEVSAFE